MRIAVIDGQGGGIGKAAIEKILSVFTEKDKIGLIALGTNAIATAAMLKVGAPEGASGANAIIYNVSRVDLIVGPIGIVICDSMLGECSAEIVCAISSSDAKKILIPFTKCNTEVAGVAKKPLSGYLDDMVESIKLYLKD